MNLNWQEVVTIALVGIALVYLSYRIWLVAMGARSAGCGPNTCKSCPSSADTVNGQEKQFVSLDQLSQQTHETPQATKPFK